MSDFSSEKAHYQTLKARCLEMAINLSSVEDADLEDVIGLARRLYAEITEAE